MGFADAERESLFSKYMREMKKWPVLTLPESTKLFQEMEEGSPIARKKIINSNLRLVISVAKRYTSNGSSMDDIIQEGNIGLMRAVERFDWKKGYRFSTYAIWWIRQSIGQHLTKTKRIVRMPAHIVGLCKKMRAAIEEDEGISITDLSNATGASPKMVKAAVGANGSIVSLDAPRKFGPSAGGELEKRWIDIISDPSLSANPADCFSEKQLVQIVKRVMDEELSAKESIVLRLRYGLTDEMKNSSKEEIESLKACFEGDPNEEETNLFDSDGPGWDGIQEDHGILRGDGLEDELQLSSELVAAGHEENGEGIEPCSGSEPDRIAN